MPLTATIIQGNNSQIISPMHLFSRHQLLVIPLIAATCLLCARATDRETSDWKPLFDGKTTAGWRAYGRPDFPQRGWNVEDGCLHLAANGGGGDIITLNQFTDFELEWEWRITLKGNNGIKYLVTEARPKSPGHEYQMVDDTTESGPQHQTASFYDVLPPQTKPRVHPPGEWNQSRLVIRGPHVEHWLNGEKVLTYELGSRELLAAIAKSKFKDAQGFGEKVKGPILLTDHHGETWFRNIKIREFSTSTR